MSVKIMTAYIRQFHFNFYSLCYFFPDINCNFRRKNEWTRRWNLRSRCTGRTGCSAWRGRGRACWSCPLAGTRSRCTCRIWQELSALRGSWPGHLKRTQTVGMWGGFCFPSLFRWERFRTSDLCISDSTAEALLLGFRRTRLDTWLCCILRGLSKKENILQTNLIKKCAVHLFFKCLEERLNKHLCADAAHAEHESEGLQIGMPAVSWSVSLVFESTQHPGPCMGVNSRRDELGNASGADAQQQTEQFSQKLKQQFWPTFFYYYYRVSHHLLLI